MPPTDGAERKGTTVSLASSTLKESDYGGPDPDSELHTSVLDSDGLFRILIDAVQYNELLAGENDANSDESDEKPPTDVDGQSVRRLAGLDSATFSVEDFAATERFAQIAALDNVEPESFGETMEEPEEYSVDDLGEALEATVERPGRQQSVSQLSPSEVSLSSASKLNRLTTSPSQDRKRSYQRIRTPN